MAQGVPKWPRTSSASNSSEPWLCSLVGIILLGINTQTCQAQDHGDGNKGSIQWSTNCTRRATPNSSPLETTPDMDCWLKAYTTSYTWAQALPGCIPEAPWPFPIDTVETQCLEGRDEVTLSSWVMLWSKAIHRFWKYYVWETYKPTFFKPFLFGVSLLHHLNINYVSNLGC